MPRYPHMKCGQIPIRVKTANHLRLGDRMVPPVRHVLFTRPEQLHRRTWHLFGDCHSLPYKVSEATPPETAPERDFVDLALGGRQARRLYNRRERGVAVLGRTPNLALVGRVERGRVHRLHGRVVLVRVRVNFLHLLCRVGERGFRIAILVADKRLLGIKPGLQPFGNRRTRDLGVLAFVPHDRENIERRFGLPPGVRNDG